MEEWKRIRDFDGYWISSYGRVYTEKRKHIMKLNRSKGYYYVSLYHDGKKKYRKLVHRLVGLAFIPNPNSLPQLHHIDNDPTNNSVENLQWCTSKENINYKSKEALDKGRENGVLYCSKPIVEIINDELSIGYINQHHVPHMRQNSLSYHVSQGHTKFTCKGRTFLCPKNMI